MKTASRKVWDCAEAFGRARKLLEAKKLYTQLLSDPVWKFPALIRLTAVSLHLRELGDAIFYAKSAFSARTHEPVLNESLCEMLTYVGELELAAQCMDEGLLFNCKDPAIFAGLGRLASMQSMPERAVVLLRKAIDLGAKSAGLWYLLGQSELYLGNNEKAEEALESSLRLEADHGPTHRAIAKIRKCTVDACHVDRIRRSISRVPNGHLSAPYLYYALFKELDDLGDYREAWKMLETGMKLRRAQITYNPESDKALVEALKQFNYSKSDRESLASEQTPIFIVGLPRSGTTLLERILGGHSQIVDVGELRNFTFQLRVSSNFFGGPHLDVDLVNSLNNIDWGNVGRSYLERAKWLTEGWSYFTDKLPANVFNIGFISLALPQAKVVHMNRDPLDVCFSNLKELFSDAYPYSYDQIEMADHFLRYQDLMDHWRERFSEFVFDVQYHDLAKSPQDVAKSVLQFCELSWEDGITSIENRTSVVSTASSSQVREPVHDRYIGQWQNYTEQLAPLRERLGY